MRMITSLNIDINEHPNKIFDKKIPIFLRPRYNVIAHKLRIRDNMYCS